MKFLEKQLTLITLLLLVLNHSSLLADETSFKSSYPTVKMVNDDKSGHCNGVVLDSHTILTSGHCYPMLTLLLSLYAPNGKHQNVHIIGLEKHPLYHEVENGPILYDFMVIYILNDIHQSLQLSKGPPRGRQHFQFSKKILNRKKLFLEPNTFLFYAPVIRSGNWSTLKLTAKNFSHLHSMLIGMPEGIRPGDSGGGVYDKEGALAGIVHSAGRLEYFLLGHVYASSAFISIHYARHWLENLQERPSFLPSN